MKLITLIFVLMFSAICNASSLVNTNVDRQIDVTTNVVHELSTITVENKATTPQKSYTFVINSKQASVDTIGSIEAFLAGENKKEKNVLKVTRVSSGTTSSPVYRVDFTKPLSVGKSLKFEVEITLINSLRPYPVEIAQADRQLVLFKSNVYFSSVYPTSKQVTQVNLASDRTESYTQLKPTRKQETQIVYGPYENVAANEHVDMQIHFENNSPFLTVSSLKRSIEVSHWGNIAVEETIDMYHSGARLVGSFSRFEYMRRQGGASSVKSFKSLLPATALDVYYRDEIGNISTSNLRTPSKRQQNANKPVELELRPRFPLFGGWKTHYTVGYNVPSYQYLFTQEDNFTLRMKLIDHIYEDQVVEDAEIRIILPEYSTDIAVNVPYEVEKTTSEKHFTYLDTVGRPVVVIRRKNCVDTHMRDFSVSYKFQKYMIIKEPLLIVAFFYILFTAVIIAVRFDFAIKPSSSEHIKME